MKTDGLWYESEAGPQGVQKHIVCEKSLPSEYPLFFELFVEGGEVNLPNIPNVSVQN